MKTAGITIDGVKLAGQNNRVDHSPFPPPNAASGLEVGKANVAEYDLVVIGSRPAGQKGAIAAAKAGKRVALIERTDMIGGVSVHTGTIPSKTVREAIFQFSGLAVSGVYSNGSQIHPEISVETIDSCSTSLVVTDSCVSASGGVLHVC